MFPKTLKSAFLFLLYLTPFGYLLSLLNLVSKGDSQGIYIVLARREPVSVVVKKNPLFEDRVHWMLNGVVLGTQAYIALQMFSDITAIGAYSWIAFVYAFTNTVSAIFPSLDLNGSISGSRRGVTILGVVIILLLIFVTIYGDLLI